MNNQAIRDKVNELQSAMQKPIYTNSATGKSYSLQASYCTTVEVQRFIATGGAFPAAASWYSAGLWTYDGGHVTNDCNSWTDNTNTIEGPVSYPSDPAHGELCNASHPILCCD